MRGALPVFVDSFLSLLALVFHSGTVFAVVNTCTSIWLSPFTGTGETPVPLVSKKKGRPNNSTAPGQWSSSLLDDQIKPSIHPDGSIREPPYNSVAQPMDHPHFPMIQSDRSKPT